MGRKADFHSAANEHKWESTYNNSAEELYPHVFHPATGKPLRTLTEAEDKHIVRHATKAMKDAD